MSETPSPSSDPSPSPSSDPSPSPSSDGAPTRGARARVPPRRPATSATARSAPPPPGARLNLKKWAPYLAGALTVVTIVGLARIPRFAAPASLAGALVILGLLAWVAVSFREPLTSDDRLRALVLPAVLTVVAATAVPLAYTVFPPEARGRVALRSPGDAGTIDLRGGADLWAEVEGQFARDATGTADFSADVSVDGRTARLSGRLLAHEGELTARENLALRGPGTLRVELRGLSSALTPPLRIAVHARPIPTPWLAAVYLALLLLVVAIDVALYHRGGDPSFAAAMTLPLVAVLYLQLRPVGGASLPSHLAASALVGALAGGLGGEALARLGRRLSPK
jgi:hypothetical protein